ncbi:NfeD family protein [Patescibacteria group bacterium]|nr:NfeD family protein [Patescibacteria group bacterium]
MDNNYLLVIGGIVCVIVEILLGAVTGFDLLLIGIILMVSGGLGIMLGSFSTALVATVVLVVVYLIAGRRFIKQKLAIATKETNVDRLIGKKAFVVKKIETGRPGQVKFEGEIWRAESDRSIAVDQGVVIESVSGVTLRVK